MPRILRIINRFNLGGPTYNAAYLSKYLPDNYETLLIGGQWDPSEESSLHILDSLGVNYHIVPKMRRSLNPLSDYQAMSEIKKIAKDFKPDIIHTHASKAGAIGRKVAFSLGNIKTVHTFHGHVFHSYFNPIATRVYKQVEKNLAKKTDAIIAISEIQKKELTEIYKVVAPEKVHVIPLGFDLSRFTQNTEEKRKRFRENYQIAEDEIAIGIIGRLVPIKNHDLFIESILKLSYTTQKKIKAFIIGDGESREHLQELCSKLRLEFSNQMPFNSLINFTSWIKNIDEALAGLDIIALTSYNEGTPVSLIEAQAAGKPIVTTDVGGIHNTVLENKTALIAKDFRVEGLTELLKKLVEDESLRTEFSKNGWEFVKDKFHYTRLVKDVDKLYTELLTV